MVSCIFNNSKAEIKISDEILKPLYEDLNTPGYIANLHQLYEKAKKGEDQKLFISACKFVGLLNESNETWEKFKKNKVSINESEIQKKIELRNKASLNSIKIFNDNEKTYNLSANCVYLSKESYLNSFSLIKGGIFTRSETHAYLNGCNAKLNLNGVYISCNKQHHDLTTAIYHDVPDCTSKQIVRGVLGGKSTGVFQGKVRVAQDGYNSY